MKRHLEISLIKNHPRLYSSYINKGKGPQYRSIGLGDGWFDILWELSNKLEKMIEQHIKKYGGLDKCSHCSCSEDSHIKEMNECVSVYLSCYHFGPHGINSYPVFQKKHFYDMFSSWRRFKAVYKGTLKPYLRGKYRSWSSKLLYPLNRLMSYMYDKWSFGFYEQCHCVGFIPTHPRATTIKSKVGELRLYMATATDEIFDLIDEYTIKSRHICEYCGKPGVSQVINNWLSTLCEECADNERKRKRDSTV